MKILITGSNGYIGSQLFKILGKQYDCFTINRSTFDLTNNYETQKWFTDKFFDIVIHTAIKGGSRLGNDTSAVLDSNIKMYLNLLDCKDHYNKFLNIGSGAEINSSNTFYGLSKKCIFESIMDKKFFYSLRIFGLFNYYELDTRFIKANIIRYLNKTNLFIYQDKLMDFIFFNDFVSIITKYIESFDVPKNIDCVYKEKYLLSDIAQMINSLGQYRVSVDILKNESIDNPYVGEYNDLGLLLQGLHNGILQTYLELQNDKKSMVRPK